LTWAAKCRPTLTCGILTAVIFGRQSHPTALAVILYHKIIISFIDNYTYVAALTVTAINASLDDTREVVVGGSVGRQYRHVCRGLNGLNR